MSDGGDPVANQGEGERRIVKLGRRRAVSRPAAHVEPLLDPAVDDRSCESSKPEADSAQVEEARDAWLRAQRPPHWQ